MIIKIDYYKVLEPIMRAVEKRIFEDGLASDMSPIGLKKDGTLTKLTGSGALRNSLQIKDGNIVIEDKYNLEIKYGKRIFALTETEMKLFHETWKNYLKSL
jgi:hypothetical protein